MSREANTTSTRTTPAGTAGAADVVVTTPYGDSGVSGDGAFTYVGPVVTSLSPTTGPADTAARHDPRPIAFAGTCSKTKIIGDGRARRMLCDGPRASS